MTNFKLTAAQIATYHKDGCLVVKDFLNNEEIKKLQDIAFEDGVMHKHVFDLNDQTGKKTKLTLWYKPGNDTYGLLTRSSLSLIHISEPTRQAEISYAVF